MPHLNLLYVLADGARARLVERSRETGDFITFAEIDARDRLEGLRRDLRGNPASLSQQSGPRTSHTATRGDSVRLAKEAFVHEVAERAAEVAKTKGFEGVIVAAPARLLAPLRSGLAHQHAHVSGSIERDLTKAPDSALPKWLDHVLPA